MTRRDNYDVVIIGGGFFGCCLALALRSVTQNILVIEQEPALLTHASRVNQARVHSGYHYPRSFVTALRSQQLRARFARHFEAAVVDDFEMFYAIARRRSKVSAKRFERMFESMGAAIASAPPGVAALFNADLIEQVFACSEFAFDWSVLQAHLSVSLAEHGIEIAFATRAERVVMRDTDVVIELADGSSVTAPFVFNVTYAGLNNLLASSGFPLLPLKHELTELVLVEPSAEIEGKAVTVMDGPFFSLMPYPSRGLYSLTHVSYTPHASWVDSPDRPGSNYAVAEQRLAQTQSRWRHMMMDARRYLPCCGDVTPRDSLFEIKTILTRNERDDGRPILLHRHSGSPGFYSIMGGKLDNVFDLLDVLPAIDPRFGNVSDSFLPGQP